MTLKTILIIGADRMHLNISRLLIIKARENHVLHFETTSFSVTMREVETCVCVCMCTSLSQNIILKDFLFTIPTFVME